MQFKIELIFHECKSNQLFSISEVKMANVYLI